MSEKGMQILHKISYRNSPMGPPPFIKKCTFIRYGVNDFGYHLWDYENNKIIRSRDVIFNGAPYLIQKLTTFMPPLGHSLTTGAPVSVFCTSFPHLFIILLYKHLLFPTFVFVVIVGDLLSFLAIRNPCHPWLEHHFSFTLTGIVYVFRVLPRSFTIYPLNLLTLSRLWHNLPRILSSP
jgi:hypothetical protein